jgi:signal transduction histidine kinase
MWPAAPGLRSADGPVHALRVNEADVSAEVPAPKPGDPPRRTLGRYSRLRQRQLVAINVTWARRRPYLIAAYMAIVLTLLALAEYPTTRIALLGALAVVALGVVTFEAVTVDPQDRKPRTPMPYLVCVTAIQVTAIGITGGATSPLVTLLLGPSLAEALVRGRSRDTAISLGVNTLGVVVLGILPDEWRGPAIQAPWEVVLATLTLLYSLFMSGALVASLTDAANAAGERLEHMREDLLNQSMERTRSLEAVSSKVAHELKNPLAAVKALVQLLSSNAPDDRSKQRLEVVRGEIARMEQIMHEYLSFSRPLQDLRTEPVELAELSDGILAVLEARASDAGVGTIRIGGPASVVGDPRRLKEALLNLVSNAIEATPRGGNVEIRVAQRPGAAEVVVKDDGKGIPAEFLPRVGTPFFTMREGGTGLGVLLAKTVVAQHGGELNFASEQGRGTSVTVRLPLVPPRPADQSLADVSGIVPVPTANGRS